MSTDSKVTERLDNEIHQPLCQRHKAARRIFDADCRREEKAFVLHTLPCKLPTLFTARFSASADYEEGDVFIIKGEHYAVLNADMNPAATGIFKAGATIMCHIDMARKLAFLALNVPTDLSDYATIDYVDVEVGKKTDRGAGFIDCDCAYTSGVFSLTPRIALSDPLPGVITVRFHAAADYTGGDQISIASQAFPVRTIGMDAVEDGVFKAGTVLRCDIDFAAQQAVLGIPTSVDLSGFATIDYVDGKDAEVWDRMLTLQSVSLYLNPHDFGSAEPSQAELTAYALAETGLTNVDKPLSVVNIFNGNEWIYNPETGLWTDYGRIPVRIASNERYGIVKGDTETGKISVLADGTMQANGLAPLDSPEFTGEPKAPTPDDRDDSDRVATTSFVKARLAEIDDSGSSSAPLPSIGEGIGKWVVIGTTLPAGGTWAYWALWQSLYQVRYTSREGGSSFDSGPAYRNGGAVAGIAAGGTVVVPAANNYYYHNPCGFAWRIA